MAATDETQVAQPEFQLEQEKRPDGGRGVDEAKGPEPGETPKLDVPEVKPADEDDPLELFEPRMRPIERRLGTGDGELVLWQKPLSFMGRWEFFALIGNAISDLMNEEEGVTLQALLESIGVEPGRSIEGQMSQAEVIIKGFARLSKVAPDLLYECFTIWLDIEPRFRDYARLTMRKPVDEGGFDDDTGWDIIEAFVEQNAVEIIAFFTERLPDAMQMGQKLRQFADHKRSSRRSRRSQQPEQSQSTAS